MEVDVRLGKYIVAVSGGVDSVVLLDVLNKKKELEVVVAHFDHGIREDSPHDRKFVQALAKKYGLAFEYAEGNLGPDVSEATAREARYTFLRAVKEKYEADAIIVAHHQDDLIETAMINLLRGTGRKGLTSLSSGDEIVRPLLEYSKREITNYAKKHGLVWREDSTNKDVKYLRNYVRLVLLPKLSVAQRENLLRTIQAQRSVNAELDKVLAKFLSAGLDKKRLLSLGHKEAAEVVVAWLRENNVTDIDRKAVERAVVGVKTAKPGKRIVIKNNLVIEVGKNKLALDYMER